MRRDKNKQKEERPAPVSEEISKRKRAEARLEMAEESFQLMIAAAKDYAFFLMNQEGKITSWNKGAENIFGWKEDEVLNQPLE